MEDLWCQKEPLFLRKCSKCAMEYKSNTFLFHHQRYDSKLSSLNNKDLLL